MELHQLEYLVAVADEGSFTRAAASLHVSQPAVSAQIRKLERELGEVLLDRSAAGVRPTAVGEAVLAEARAAVAAVARIRDTVAAHRGLLQGRVRLGVIGNGLSPDLADLLAAFARAHPGVEVSVSEGRGAELLDALLGGRTDLAIVGIVGDPPAGIATETLSDEVVVAAVGPHDPLADRGEVTLAELAGRPLIAMPVGSGLRAGVDAALAAAGVTPRIAYEAGTPAALGELAVRGLGVALVPESVVPSVDGLVALALRPPLHGRVDLAWPASRSVAPAARALLAHLRSGLRNRDDPLLSER
ncbi:transcriptional regulator, LysR family [Pseudonocardia thermophila]|jgi:Transcriptional regulator|uniref:Transcriptional regulator, LysR family n=1 Tax=Pseudonocardia thermophila TaxID=1848 RepID=A0A1M6W782_PSETH|nr:LysR family transcriptional regulator [Pseudonocardia thermophila]SHK89634.1 transcriptional regulator, LysR family [Pseudonocardia thermophila]